MKYYVLYNDGSLSTDFHYRDTAEILMATEFKHGLRGVEIIAKIDKAESEVTPLAGNAKLFKTNLTA